MLLFGLVLSILLKSQKISAALTVQFPDPKLFPERDPAWTGRAKYQPYGPARAAAANSFSKWSRSQHFEDKTLFSRYFYGMMNGTVIESGAMVACIATQYMNL